MNLYRLYWAPTAETIGFVEAKTPQAARRKAPRPYRKYLGEIGVELIPPVVVQATQHGIYRIVWRADDSCHVTSMCNRTLIDSYVRGAWLDTGRLPDDVRDFAMSIRPATPTLPQPIDPKGV